MTLHWYTVVVDARDPRALGHWWAQTMGYQVIYEEDHEVVLVPGWLEQDSWPDIPWERRSQGMVFVSVPEDKTIKNRLHIDLAPHTSQDRDAEITALLDRGATRVQVGQDDSVTWTVLADPEGNEFCVLSSRDM